MNKFKRYAELKGMIKELTLEAKEIEQALVGELSESDGNKLQTKQGTFSLYYRKTYKYTDELTTKEKLAKEQIKLMKKKEEIEGKAELQEKATMRFVGVK